MLLAVCSAHADLNLGRTVIIGDSITQASGYAYNSTVYSQNACRSYRWELFKALVDAGASFEFVGSLANNYTSDSHYPVWRGLPFDRAMDGHFGWRAREILNGPDAGRTSANRGTGSIYQWTDVARGGYVADTAIIMAGINDLNDSGVTGAQVSNYVAGIVSVLQAQNPFVRVYLCHVLQVGSGHSSYVGLNTAVDDYNGNKLPGIAAAKTTATSLVTVIDMLGPTNNGANFWVPRPGGWNPNAGEMTISDNVHPNSRGERHIASCIAAALGLISEWTAVAVTNGNFEGGFSGAGTVNCAPAGWTLYGSPNVSAVPKQITDYQVVAESIVDRSATGTSGSAGSSYVLAGTADTGIRQIIGETLTAGRRYLLQGNLYAGSSALTAGDWAVEVWAGGTRVGYVDNQIKLKPYSAGTGYQIGSALTEVTAEFDASDFPTVQGQPLEIHLISRNVSRYVGFEDIRLSWKPSPVAGASRHLKVYVLTGQSNSLGTDSGTEVDKLPGTDPADALVPFWWHNVTGDIYGISASPGLSVGDCGGFWRSLRAQFGNNAYSNVGNAWGPEINFARSLWHAGQTNFVIIKASRGGGGNSFWCKTNADNHMYVHLTNTVGKACARLVADGHTFEVAGLLYLQGESDSAAEQAIAGQRFKLLVDNLRADLQSATGMKGYMLGNLTTATTRAQQEAIAAANPSYLFYGDSMDLTDEWVSDNVHMNKKAKLVTGARFAQLVLGRIAHFDASAGYGSVHGQQYGNGSAGVAPLAGLTTVLAECSPVLQGWSETPGSSAMLAAASAAANQSAASLLPDSTAGVAAWNITDGDVTGGAYYYTRKFTGTETTNLAASGWVYTLNLRLSGSYDAAPSFFFQYGDDSVRWRVAVQRDSDGVLSAQFHGPTGLTASVLQSSCDDEYHALVLRKRGGIGMNAELVFDEMTVAEVAAIPASAALERGVHFGTQDGPGKGAANISRVEFAAATQKSTSALLYLAGANGTISGAQSQTVAYGADGTSVTALAVPDYLFYSWSDGRTDNPRVDTNVVFDLVVRANFIPANVQSNYTLIYLAGPNGRISGAATQTVAYGMSGATVTATPGGGYAFDGWSDGKSANPRIDLNVSSNLVVTANFSPIAGALFWDGGVVNIGASGDGVSQGGAGTWNSVLQNWDRGSGLSHVAWAPTNIALFGGAGGTVALGAAIAAAGVVLDADSDIGLVGAYGFTVNGSLDLWTAHDLTIGNRDGGILNLSGTTLWGTARLTVNKSTDTYYSTTAGSFNAPGALAFNGTLALRGGTPSTSPAGMQGASGRFWLHSQNGSQAPGTAFFLDTGAGPTNGQDFIIGDWNSTGSRSLRLSGLSGYGTIRTDAGTAGTRLLVLDQAADTTFNGMILSHCSTAGVARGLTLEKTGEGSLTLAGIVGHQTLSAAAGELLSIHVIGGTLVLRATNTLTGPTTVTGGRLVINGIHPAVSAVQIDTGGTLSGNGLINGGLTVNGTLAPGDGLGRLRLTMPPLLSGVILMEINRTNATTADNLQVSGMLTYGGILVVTNTGPHSLEAGDSFVLFSSAGWAGGFSGTDLPPLTPGLGWDWRPADGTLTVIQAINVRPTNLVCTASNGQMQLSWPTDRTGWTLEYQTNELGTNWLVWSGSSNANLVVVTNFQVAPAMFFRLRFP